MAYITGGTTGAIQEIDSTFKAGRVTIRPMEVSGWISVGSQTGLLTTAAAGGAIFSFRNASANPIIVRRVGIGVVCSTAFTTAQVVDFGLVVARAFSASDSGGTAIALTGNNAKHRTSLATLTSVDCRIATTAALTAGTKTLDTNTLSQAGGWVAGVGTIIPTALDNLLSHDTGDYPLVLAQNEGFNVQNLTLMGAAGVFRVYINVELAEATAF